MNLTHSTTHSTSIAPVIPVVPVIPNAPTSPTTPTTTTTTRPNEAVLHAIVVPSADMKRVCGILETKGDGGGESVGEKGGKEDGTGREEAGEGGGGIDRDDADL